MYLLSSEGTAKTILSAMWGLRISDQVHGSWPLNSCRASKLIAGPNVSEKWQDPIEKAYSMQIPRKAENGYQEDDSEPSLQARE